MAGGAAEAPPTSCPPTGAGGRHAAGICGVLLQAGHAHREGGVSAEGLIPGGVAGTRGAVGGEPCDDLRPPTEWGEGPAEGQGGGLQVGDVDARWSSKRR